MRNKPHSRYVAILLSLLLLFALSSCDLSGLQRNMLITPQGSEEVNNAIKDTVTNITNPTEGNEPSKPVSDIITGNSDLSEEEQEAVNNFLNKVINDPELGEASELLNNVVAPIDPAIKETLASAGDVDLKNMNAAFSEKLSDDSALKKSVTDTVDLVKSALEEFTGSSGGSSSGFDMSSIFNEYDSSKLTVADAVAMQIVSDVVFNNILTVAADTTDGVLNQDGSLKEGADVMQMLQDSSSSVLNDAVSSLRLIDKLDTTIFAPNMISNMISSLTSQSGN